MARPAKGQVVLRQRKRDTVFALRFMAYGRREYLTLGSNLEGWNRQGAQEELENVLADVRRGIWTPHQPEVIEPPKCEQTFHEFADKWFEEHEHEWAERTIRDYQWALEMHVLPFFADYRLSEITIEDVDAFKAAKLKEGKLAPAQINKCIKRVSQILEVAEEYDLISKNPARGKKRKAKEPEVERTWVEPEQMMALIEEATLAMRPVVALLVGTGVRNGELCAMEEGSVNLATATGRVGRAKTKTGSFRELDLPAGVVEILTEWKLRSGWMRRTYEQEHPGESPIFLTEHGGVVRRQTEANIDRRLKTCIRRANKKLKKLGIEPISEKVTPHSLRRTYASVRAALKDDPLYVSEQMGHKDVRFTLNVYSRAVKRRSKLSGAYLAEFDRALAWAALSTPEKAPKGTSGVEGLPEFEEQVSYLA
jgi:integrase